VRRLPTLLLGAVLFGSLSAEACQDSSHQDTKQPPQRNFNKAPADHVILFQDEFPTVATKCAGFDHYRVWVVSHTKTDVQPVIMTDESCP